MNNIEHFLEGSPYAQPAEEKGPRLLSALTELTAFHQQNCPLYAAMLKAAHQAPTSLDRLAQLPFLPVGLFKRLELKSIPDEAVLKTLTSSGTTSQTVSKIFVDRQTSTLQTKALASIVTHFIGPKRLPMIIIDSAAQVRQRTSLSARGAGIVGLANFGRHHFYALDEHMRLDVEGLKAFIERHAGGPILLFGFTFMVWKYLYGELKRNNEVIRIPEGILIHSGGWKKLQDEKVSNELFKAELLNRCGIPRIHNFYGMVEQVGSIYMECECGRFHAPNSAEILIRDPISLELCPPGQTGLIQTLSVLPQSYPGHSLLTEDLGEIAGIDDCPCGRMGTHFLVHGRMAKAELRGCSDTHAASLTSSADDAVSLLFPRGGISGSLDEVLPPSWRQAEPLPSFSAPGLEFLTGLSKALLTHHEARAYPELIALGYWLRRANLETTIRSFLATVPPNEIVAPRGLVFHVAPANVDTIFLYSWALSLLSGNLNILRVSSRLTRQMELLLAILQSTAQSAQPSEVLERNFVVTYPHSEAINRKLSQQADARMIWGGDATVDAFRALPTKTFAKDVVFSDKFSYAVVGAGHYLRLSPEARAEQARLFFNDSYSFDQMACSSPRIVYFSGTVSENEAASAEFWRHLTAEVQRRDQPEDASIALEKMNTALQAAAQNRGIRFTRFLPSGPTVLHAQMEDMTASRLHCGGGFFYECFLSSLTDLEPSVQAEDQTLSYSGFSQEEMRAAAPALCRKGLSRIVPFGQALDFSATWDGYVLMNELTRRISVK